MDATWRTLGTICRERDWSRQRLLYELQNGLRYRTVPPGRVIDWHHSNVRRWLNVEASEVSFYDEEMAKARSYSGPHLSIISLGLVTVGIEVLPPTDAEMPAAASAQWAIATTRRLQGENKIPEGITKAELARLLEAEAQKAVKTGQFGRALKASYLENQLDGWGIWPLNSFK